MIHLKTDEEIEILRENNILVSRTLAEVGRHIRPGVTTRELDKIAEDFIRANGAVPACLGYEGYPAATCISVNEQVVHGIPSDRVIEEGDLVSVDLCTLLKGFVGDSAYTFAVGEVGEEARRLLAVTKEALYKGTTRPRECSSRCSATAWCASWRVTEWGEECTKPRVSPISARAAEALCSRRAWSSA